MNAVLEPTLFAAAGAAPTRVTYSELQQAYDHFNARLFGGQLPGCLITLQREKRTCGYFSAARFASLDGGTTDEIAMNPTYFAAVPLIETMQTMVHEMCHLWQHHFGTPGRGRYHNEEWASKMEAVGLMPSSTGQPGGKRTGDMMADYALSGGRFLEVCAELLTSSFQLSWYDRFPAEDHVRLGQQVAAASHLWPGRLQAADGNSSCARGRCAACPRCFWVWSRRGRRGAGQQVQQAEVHLQQVPCKCLGQACLENCLWRMPVGVHCSVEGALLVGSFVIQPFVPAQNDDGCAAVVAVRKVRSGGRLPA